MDRPEKKESNKAKNSKKKRVKKRIGRNVKKVVQATIFKMDDQKKPSAHNIANGFAVERRENLKNDNESIKERLNKLLRGDL